MMAREMCFTNYKICPIFQLDKMQVLSNNFVTGGLTEISSLGVAEVDRLLTNANILKSSKSHHYKRIREPTHRALQV